MKGKLSKNADIDLGLAVSGALLKPNQTRSIRELAAYCGISHTAIEQIEHRALRKMRIRLIQNGLTQEEIRLALSAFR